MCKFKLFFDQFNQKFANVIVIAKSYSHYFLDCHISCCRKHWSYLTSTFAFIKDPFNILYLFNHFDYSLKKMFCQLIAFASIEMQIIETKVFVLYVSVINNINFQMQMMLYQLQNRQYFLFAAQLHGYVDSQV